MKGSRLGDGIQERMQRLSTRNLDIWIRTATLDHDRTWTRIFYHRRMRKFSKPDKMMGLVERHIETKMAGKFECCHPVCKEEGIVLNNVILFENHVEYERGTVGVIRALLTNGVDVSSMDVDGALPARMAARSMNLEGQAGVADNITSLLVGAGGEFDTVL